MIKDKLLETNPFAVAAGDGADPARSRLFNDFMTKMDDVRRCAAYPHVLQRRRYVALSLLQCDHLLVALALRNGMLASRRQMINGRMPFTVHIEDPMANSFVYSPFAPGPDPRLEVRQRPTHFTFQALTHPPTAGPLALALIHTQNRVSAHTHQVFS